MNSGRILFIGKAAQYLKKNGFSIFEFSNTGGKWVGSKKVKKVIPLRRVVLSKRLPLNSGQESQRDATSSSKQAYLFHLRNWKFEAGACG
ncbi:hypothetical protein CDAR_51151 [Caerostris darwini]|uniref:Uncharacterized protein n=1 Tax=Caerostris darwini TaxID=1538125 RepID=A0AAV4U5Z6_9ARAC|nr:hypothetical protein CDAR_51151 [Caerostris darwini]